MAQPMPQPKFKVLKALGKGSYGTVYKVQRLADGNVYAMKETDLGRMGPKERADAVNEIRVLGSVNHPNVVRHHETFLSGAKLCIVMEYAPAGDLASFIRAAGASKLQLPESTVWQIFLQMCQGMQAIHETCVIHRDMKPANIFMCPDNVVKVGDLGVAKALTKAHYAQTTIGTPVFMAPEVWRGLKYSYSSDLWSLGAVLYEMMTYRLPFDARSLNELKNKIIMGSFAPLIPNAPYSTGLVAVCHALLNRDPAKRPTCAAILNSSEAAPWLHTIPEAVRLPLPPLDALPSIAPMNAAAPAGGPNPALLPTIHVPRDIRLLPHRLPKPSYGDGLTLQHQLAPPTAAAVPARVLAGMPAAPAAVSNIQRFQAAAAAAAPQMKPPSGLAAAGGGMSRALGAYPPNAGGRVSPAAAAVLANAGARAAAAAGTAASGTPPGGFRALQQQGPLPFKAHPPEGPVPRRVPFRNAAGADAVAAVGSFGHMPATAAAAGGGAISRLGGLIPAGAAVKPAGVRRAMPAYAS